MIKNELDLEDSGVESEGSNKHDDQVATGKVIRKRPRDESQHGTSLGSR